MKLRIPFGTRIPFGAIFAVVAKGAKLLTFAKPALVFGSMALSVFAYSFYQGPLFAILFVALLFIHELGHVAALRMKGHPAPPMVFIPFLGAAIFMQEPASRDEEAFIGYGGPLLGTIGVLMVTATAFAFSGEWHTVLMSAALLGSFINLFNLIPLRPLDGGRVLQVLGPWAKLLGIGLLGALSIAMREPAIILIWVVIIPDLGFAQPKVSAILMAALTLAMTVLFCLGYSEQAIWANLIDILVCCLFVFLTWTHSAENMDDRRPYNSNAVRVKWSIYYIALCVALVGIMAFQWSLLPHQSFATPLYIDP